MNIKNKKAQVTMFIIIGIIILIVSGIIITIKIMTETSYEEEIITRASETPIEFQPISDYITSCIKDTGKDGIKKLGFHGGYIELDRYGIQASSSNPTQSRALLFNPQDKDSGVVYWHYFKSNNECEDNCGCSTEQPYLKKNDGGPNIETQIEDYIDENLEDCLLDFLAFKNQGFEVIAEDDVETTVTIRDNDVLLYVKYKVEVKKEKSEFKIKEYITTVPVELKKIYELAEQIKTSELKFNYIEKWTIEQLTGLGIGVKQDRLPPIAASELSPGEKPVYWIKQKVKEDIINNMLPLYTPFFSVFNTKNYNTEALGTFYERATIPIGSPEGYDYSNLDVKFNYFNWWPIYFDITGRGISGQRIGPEKTSSSFFSFIGIKRYNFYYDLSYPILIDIYSEDAFNEEGFHFYFAMESNVRNNQPLNCSGPGITEYAIPSGSLLCNVDQGCADVTITAIDSQTNLPLENVNIYYSSGSESCDKGYTELNQGKTELKTSLPQCIGQGCSINAVKEGYWYYPQTLAVRCDILGGKCIQDNILCKNEGITLSMEPLRTNDIIIMKKKMIKQGEKTWTFNDVAEDLLDNEYAMVSLTKIKDNPNEETLSLASIFYGNDTSIKLKPGLIPGNYELRIDLFYQFPDYKNRNQVEFKKVEECEKIFGGLDEECYDIGPYNFTETIIEGGFVSNITLTKDMLNHDTIIFYAISSPDIDTSYNVLDGYDLEELTKTEEYSKTYKVQLKPIAK